MSDLPRERIKAIRDGGSSMARRAAVQGWLITLCDMALRTLYAEAEAQKMREWRDRLGREVDEDQARAEQAEARNRELEAGLRRMLHDPECDHQAIAWDLLAAPAPPDSEPTEGEDARLDKHLVERGAIPEWSSPYYTPPQRRDALEADINQAASLVKRGHTDLALHVLREGMRALSAGEVVVTTNERGDVVAVTRQDDEGRVLETLWERADVPNDDEFTAAYGGEPAEGAGGGDGIPQCSCVTKTPDWRHHDASCNYRVYMEDSFPPQWKGEPTVRESTHGGYVWTCCDECGPDVKVDEDGLCIACGRNAVYFGKKHPDDTPPQSRDAGDILREKLSDPKAMQRVTERAAERQDAMLERREALADLDYLRGVLNNPSITTLSQNGWVRLRTSLENIRRYLYRTSDEGTGCVVPEEGTTQFEALAKAVHNAWWDEKERQGSAIGHPDAIPYEQLSEDVKEYDRATVRTVLNAMLAAAPQPQED